jgi:D-tyrosyl-tRNA(Tyr) deacylase
MILLVQRVKKVYVSDVLNSKEGFLVFSGFQDGDDIVIVERMAKKLLSLRIFSDKDGKTNLNISDINGEILSISQFTLYAELKGYNRPSFSKCLDYSSASHQFNYFNSTLESKYDKVKKGVFGSDYQIELVNDGPFTIILDSDKI